MKNISEMKIVQIDVTNICDKSCANCTRFCGHYRPDKLYFMELEDYEKAVISLKEFPGIIGMIGGEPTLHPKFPEMCFTSRKRSARGYGRILDPNSVSTKMSLTGPLDFSTSMTTKKTRSSIHRFLSPART